MPATKDKLRVLLSDYLEGKRTSVVEIQKNLKGEKGEKGEMGERGPAGLKGDRGERGFSGRDGVDGANGINGLDGKNGVSPTISEGEIKRMINDILAEKTKPLGAIEHRQYRRAGIAYDVDIAVTGAVNGSNTVFITPVSYRSVLVWIDGVRLKTTDVTLSGTTVTVATAPVTEIVVDGIR